MRNEKHFRPVHSHGERGVALFFALGILAVLIVIVLVFSDRARTDLKISGAYANSGQAKHLAESALSRALIQLQKNAAGNFYFYSSAISDAANADTVDWLWKIGTDEFPVGTGNPMRWQYVKAPVDGGDQIIGRFAYHAIGYNPMDLNALLVHKKDLCGASDKVGGTCDVCKKRLGLSVSELTFDPAPFSAFTQATLTDKAIVYPNADFLKVALNLTNPKDLAAINQNFAIGLGDSMKELDVWQADKDGTKFFQRFNLNRDWDSITVDEIVAAPTATTLSGVDVNLTSDNFKKILWLANWKDFNPAKDYWDSGEAKAKQIAANLINYNRGKDASVVSDVDPANWNGTNIPKYTGNKRTWYLNEALVKLTLERSVVAPTSSNGQIIRDTEGKFKYKFWKLKLIVKFTLATEIINMYKDALGGGDEDKQLKYYGNLSFTYNKRTHNGNGVTTIEKKDQVFLLDLTNSKAVHPDADGNSINTPIKQTPWKSASNSNYKVKLICNDSGSGLSHFTQELDLGTYATTDENGALDYKTAYDFSKITLSDLKIVFSDKVANDITENVDYAHVLEEKVYEHIDDKGEETIFDLSLQVEDARHNLLLGCWREQPTDTLNEKNSNVPATVSDNLDSENYAGDITGGKISTAYIRHGQMESLWELGAIHRAAPWQTINLKKPTDTPDAAGADFSDSEKGGDLYEKGDFLLLDQVTFRAKNSVAYQQFGKINLLGPEAIKQFSWDALFRDGKLQDMYDSTTTTDLYANDVELKKYVTNLQKGVENVNSGNIYRRSDIFRNLGTGDFWTQFIPDSATTDAQQEQRICRFINLTKVHNQGFDSAIVVVMAQSIKDVGGGVVLPVDWDEDGEPGSRSDANMAATNAGLRTYDGTDASTLFGVGTVPAGNADVTADYGQYDMGVDKITGTAKMTAYFKYDNVQKKWKLIRVKHEE